MAEQIITIEKASPKNLEEALSILSLAELPSDGVSEHFESFLVARNSVGKLLGCIGLERHGDIGLLRSAAVVPAFRGQWIGRKLVSELLKRAAEDGITEVGLLTITAKDFFQNNFGFEEATRSRYEKRLANSPEWNLPRCSSAVFMTLKLKPKAESIS